jgi:hypothetical protein
MTYNIFTDQTTVLYQRSHHNYVKFPEHYEVCIMQEETILKTMNELNNISTANKVNDTFTSLLSVSTRLSFHTVGVVKVYFSSGLGP